MVFMIVYLFSALAAIGFGILAGWSDFKGMTIPNAIAVAVACAFFAAFGAAHFAGADDIFAPLTSHLAAGGGALAITFIMYLMKMIGGGDSKLAAAFALWTGLKGLPVFLFYMVFSGGILGIVALVLKKKKPFKNPKEGSWFARVQGGESVVPYGIPIVIGAMAAFWVTGLLAPENLKLFLMSN